MKTRILSIMTRTPLHVGAGSSVGAIDMPIQRERHTQIPIIPGSSLKGVLRDLWNGRTEEQERLFGTEAGKKELSAGELLIGEARTLCFPVRSARGSFAWLTSPLALHRYCRDAGVASPKLPDLKDSVAFAGGEVILTNKAAVVLEEYRFEAQPLASEIPALLKDFLPAEPLLASLPNRLALISDTLFSHFCANACEVQQRVRINNETHVVEKGGLFNQENVPSETLLYAVIGSRSKAEAEEELELGLRQVGNVLQIGGDETIGLGFCSIHLQGGRK